MCFVSFKERSEKTILALPFTTKFVASEPAVECVRVSALIMPNAIMRGLRVTLNLLCPYQRNYRHIEHI